MLFKLSLYFIVLVVENTANAIHIGIPFVIGPNPL